MLKPKRDDRLVACLVCFKCGARMGPNHYELRDNGVICSVCGERNPLAFLKKLSIREVNATCEIIVCFTQGGTAAHALHIDCKTALGPWTKFSSAETLDRAVVYLGATDEQMAEHRDAKRRWGQESSHIMLQLSRHATGPMDQPVGELFVAGRRAGKREREEIQSRGAWNGD